MVSMLSLSAIDQGFKPRSGDIYQVCRWSEETMAALLVFLPRVW